MFKERENKQMHPSFFTYTTYFLMYLVIKTMIFLKQLHTILNVISMQPYN